jgi:hypothetical protein
LQVRRVAQPRRQDGCHVYSALAMNETIWSRWLTAINAQNLDEANRTRPALAVGSGGRFCDLGGAICLVTDAVTNSETYRLNLDTLSRSGFRVDSQLLRPPPRPTAKLE